ncbi:MAG: hypothetical protein RDU14_16640 [Melioribacteraceae bacterium]|nr:hypothetical protein [Melioribacteraceae bacterium]
MGIKAQVDQDKKYGRLIIIKEAEPIYSPRDNGLRKTRMFLCKCNCGAEIVVRMSCLLRGTTQSCGCLHKERTSIARKSHGFTRTLLYKVYHGMIQRCTNENSTSYESYGGRGIKVCKEWSDNPQLFFEWAMANGYLKGLQIDRENNDGNYDPTNCRFITSQNNNRNRRSSKITTEEAMDIRNANDLKCFTHNEIAKAYSISINTVRKIIYNTIWN